MISLNTFENRLYKFDAVNITLGLKYVRVSPDHGTATNIIGKNKANITSTIKCFNLINKLDEFAKKSLGQNFLVDKNITKK